MPTTRRPRRLAAALLASSAALIAVAAPAGAPAAVGENGSIQLTKTSTLAAYHDGVERYVTSFEFSGEGESVGSIIPLPDIPTEVVRGGDWTLQRLTQEVAPPEAERFVETGAALASADGAEVILETQIDALDITVLKGGGDEVGRWARDNGFLLTPDAPEMLDFYGRRSPIFMAARFDASRAAELGQTAGDGTPIMLTIPTDAPWVPLRILSLGLDGSQLVEADVFLLTDDEPDLLAGGPGLSLERSEPANPLLLDDLRSDVGMEWVPTTCGSPSCSGGGRGQRPRLRPGHLAGRVDPADPRRHGRARSRRPPGDRPRTRADHLAPRRRRGGRCDRAGHVGRPRPAP